MGLLQAAVLEDALDSNAGILTLPVASEYSSRPAETATASLICEPNSHAAVAQLAEQCFRKAWVGGSSPLGGFDFCWSNAISQPRERQMEQRMEQKLAHKLLVFVLR